jgi:hypothetical protein
MTIAEATRIVVGRIDTHSQVHVEADVGGLLGSGDQNQTWPRSFQSPTAPPGVSSGPG